MAQEFVNIADEDSLIQFLQPTNAQNDEQAIEAWLNRSSAPATVQNYRKDAERFHMWIKYRGICLRNITVEDLRAYASFLGSLDDLPDTEASKWISARRWPKSDSRWRPFQGPLSISSQHQALISVQALLRWLEKTGYIPRFSASLIQVAKRADREELQYLPWEAVSYLLKAADQMPENTAEQVRYKIRTRFIVCFFVLTGARLSDLPKSTMSSISCDRNGLWWWSVKGRGGEDQKVSVPSSLLAELKKYRLSIGLSALPFASDFRPLVPSLRGDGPADENTIYVVLKKLFKKAAEMAYEENPRLGRHLAAASPQWLRNTSLKRQPDEVFSRNRFNPMLVMRLLRLR